MPPKKKKPAKNAAPSKATGTKVTTKQPTKRKIKTSGEKAIDPLHLAPGVRTSQTTI